MVTSTNFDKVVEHLKHRYLRKVDCSSFLTCPLLALTLPRVFLQWPLTVLTKQTRQAVCANNQPIFKCDVYALKPEKVMFF
jgi:hypothetical protein